MRCPSCGRGRVAAYPAAQVFIAYWREGELAVVTGRRKVLERRLAWLLVPIDALLCLGK